MKVGSGPILATEATPGSAGGQLIVPLHGFSNPDRKPETTLPGAAPPPTVPAIPPEVGPAAFDYAALEPDDAEVLRKAVARIRKEIQSTVEGVCTIGANLRRAKKILGHGRFVHWVQSECRFSLRSAENYIRASVFADDRFATVANLSPAVLYLLSAKNAPPEVVSEVLARAANGGLVSCAEVTRMFRAARQPSGLRATRPQTSHAAPGRGMRGRLRRTMKAPASMREPS
jgi:hypothetical protein